MLIVSEGPTAMSGTGVNSFLAVIQNRIDEIADQAGSSGRRGSASPRPLRRCRVATAVASACTWKASERFRRTRASEPPPRHCSGGPRPHGTRIRRARSTAGLRVIRLVTRDPSEASVHRPAQRASSRVAPRRVDKPATLRPSLRHDQAFCCQGRCIGVGGTQLGRSVAIRGRPRRGWRMPEQIVVTPKNGQWLVTTRG